MMRTHLLRLAARSTRRHRARTLLTAGMVALGVALLIIAVSWLNGIFGQLLADATSTAGHVRIVHAEYAAKEQLAPIYENIAPVDGLLEAVRAQPGVSAAEPRIATGVTVTVGDEIGEVFALAVGASESYFRDQVRALDSIDRGRWFEGEGELVMGHRMARRLGADIGDEVVLLGMTQDGSLSPVAGALVGILNGGNSFLDQQVFMPLEQAQWLTDIPDGAIEVLVFGEHYTEADVLAGSLRDLPAVEGLAVQPWTQRDPWAGMMEMAESMRGIIVFFIVLLAALGILNTMMMSVLERTSEIGVLRAMGLGRLGVVGIFVVEAMAIAVIGGVAGVLLGMGPAWYLDAVGIHIGDSLTDSLSSDIPMAATVHGDLTAEIVAGGFMLGLFTAVLGSFIPALRAASVQPVVAMRTRR